MTGAFGTGLRVTCLFVFLLDWGGGGGGSRWETLRLRGLGSVRNPESLRQRLRT